VSAPQDQTGMARPRDQVNHERAMGEVSDVLLNLEHTLNRTRKALKVVAKTGTEINAELALTGEGPRTATKAAPSGHLLRR